MDPAIIAQCAYQEAHCCCLHNKFPLRFQYSSIPLRFNDCPISIHAVRKYHKPYGDTLECKVKREDISYLAGRSLFDGMQENCFQELGLTITNLRLKSDKLRDVKELDINCEIRVF